MSVAHNKHDKHDKHDRHNRHDRVHKHDKVYRHDRIYAPARADRSEHERMGVRRAQRLDPQSGVIVLALLASALPLVIIVCAAVMTMNSRNQGVLAGMASERAFQAAEAGLDQSLYLLNRGTIVMDTPYEREFEGGAKFSFVAEDLRTDNTDNDEDGNSSDEEAKKFAKGGPGHVWRKRGTIFCSFFCVFVIVFLCYSLTYANRSEAQR